MQGKKNKKSDYAQNNSKQMWSHSLQRDNHSRSHECLYFLFFVSFFFLIHNIKPVVLDSINRKYLLHDYACQLAVLYLFCNYSDYLIYAFCAFPSLPPPPQENRSISSPYVSHICDQMHSWKIWFAESLWAGLIHTFLMPDVWRRVLNIHSSLHVFVNKPYPGYRDTWLALSRPAQLWRVLLAQVIDQHAL